jgi:DNA-binding MarR family transcriptional regulator
MLNYDDYRCRFNLFAVFEWGVSVSERVLLYDRLKETFLLLDFGDRQFLMDYGLTVSRYYALVHIAAEPGISPSLLSNRMFCDKSNITRLLQSMEAEGYIERRAHESDRRLQRLYLSPSGRHLQQRAQTAHETFTGRRLAGIESQLLEQMAAMLAQLNQQLDMNWDVRRKFLIEEE